MQGQNSRYGVFRAVWQRNCPIIHFVLILSVDTSSSSGSIAVLRDDQVIGSVSAWTTELYSSSMFRQLESLLRELSLKVEDFDLFAIAIGPGSFTGLRVGLAAVKGWAEVYHKPIAAVSALAAVAAQSQSEDALIASVLDARRGQVYFATYRRNGEDGRSDVKLVGDERVVTPKEFWEALEVCKRAATKLSIVTPVPELLISNASRCETTPRANNNFQIEHASSILAPYVGRLGWLRAQHALLADSLTLDANYVRRSDAELHWKASPGT
jgi:tRNA threonylcarbamoyladenosine biosynthesis protein TsaB